MPTRQVGPFGNFIVGSPAPLGPGMPIQLPGQIPMLSVMINNRSGYTINIYPNQTAPTGQPQSVNPYTETTSLLDSVTSCYLQITGTAQSVNDYINIVFSDTTSTSQTSSAPAALPAAQQITNAGEIALTGLGTFVLFGGPLLKANQSFYLTSIDISGLDFQRLYYTLAPGTIIGTIITQAFIQARGNYSKTFSNPLRIATAGSTPATSDMEYTIQLTEAFIAPINLVFCAQGYVQ